MIRQNITMPSRYRDGFFVLRKSRSFGIGTGFFLRKNEEPLAKIVERGENEKTDQCGDHILCLLGTGRKKVYYEKFCNAVSDHIADSYIQNVAQEAFPVTWTVIERVILIEKIAEDSGKDVVCRVGDPVIPMEHKITKGKYSISEHRVHAAHQKESQQCFVKNAFVFHVGFIICFFC